MVDESLRMTTIPVSPVPRAGRIVVPGKTTLPSP